MVKFIYHASYIKMSKWETLEALIVDSTVC